MTILEGKGVSGGIGFGKLLKPVVSEGTSAEPTGDGALAYASAKAMASSELRGRITADDDLSAIMRSHLELLDDPDVNAEIRVALGTMGPKAAVSMVYGKYESLFRRSSNQMLRDRVSDVADLRSRLLRCLDGIPEADLSHLEESAVLCAEDLLPSQLASIDRTLLAGIITSAGGRNSHIAIMARSLLLPMVSGIDIGSLADGLPVCVDGFNGRVYVSPDSRTCDELTARMKQPDTTPDPAKSVVGTATTDGKRIRLKLNIASGESATDAAACDGVGLLRTEFLYLGRKSLPTEAHQLEAYRTVLERYSPNPVTIRTLDAGADKSLSCLVMPDEPNPALGLRGLRFCFANPEVFNTQLRALVRASAYGKLRIMFPMVCGLEDLRRARSMLSQADAALRREGCVVGPYEVGVMIETPAAAVLAAELAGEADFGSIGTNDLVQYTCAADRQGAYASDYYQSFSPAVFRLIRHAVEAFDGKLLGVCGEMAGDPRSARLLVGLGIRELSMDASCVSSVREAICAASSMECEETASRVLKASCQDEVLACL